MQPAELSELRPTVMEIDLSALRHNFTAIRNHIGNKKIMAVVKANAYGQGIAESARAFAEAGADFFGVALPEEGIELRRAGITQPILVFGGLFGAQIHQYLEYDLDITASSVDKLSLIETAAQQSGKHARVHLKIDTGLGRVGVQHDRLPPFANAALACKHIDLIGVYSHFATAEDADQSFAQTQIVRFQHSLDYLKSRGIRWQLAHLANSAAVMQMPESYFDMVRPGLALYGVSPSRNLEHVLPLRPAMALKSHIVYFKVLNAGSGISYGQKYHPQNDTRIVTIPAGYGDGIHRALSGSGEVLIGARRHPIAGNICMDQLMVDIGPGGTAYNGDEAVLIGTQGDEAITVTEIAEKINTTPHEILTSLNMRLPRVYL